MGETRTANQTDERKLCCSAALLLSCFLIRMVHVYRATLGKIMGGHCRYEPSCSQYMIDAINLYGPVRGSWRGFKRICRCHPFGGGGHDPA